MKKAKMRTFLAIAGSLALIFVFAMCSGPVVSLNLGAFSEYGSVYLRIEMPKAMTTSAVSDADTLTVIMSSTDYPSIVETVDISGGLGTAQIDNVRPGTWMITVHLRNSTGDILYLGNQGIDIVAGTTYNVTILLEATSGVGIEFDFVIEQVLLDDESMGTISYLETPGDILLSPDDTSLYVASNGDDAITVFSLDGTTGRMTFVEEHQDGDEIDTSNGEWQRMAISSDGANLYEVSGNDADLSVFDRDAGTGALTNKVTIALVQPNDYEYYYPVVDVAVSPDDEHVYVAAGWGQIEKYDRNLVTGALTYDASFDISGVIDAGSWAGGWEDELEAWDMMISPDGANLYVVYHGAGTFAEYLAVLSRDSDSGSGTFGDLAYQEDHNDGLLGMSGALTVAIPPDGKHVYVGSQSGSTSRVAIFSRNHLGDGTLIYADQYYIGGSSEYAGVIKALTNTTILIVGSGQESSALFSRDETTGLIAPVTPLNINAENIAVTADLSRFYVADWSGNRVVFMDRLQ